MRRALIVELRRGVGVWSALPLAAAMSAIALAHPREWAGDWYGLAYYLRTALILFGPLVVAAAAWQGARERRRGMVELLQSASRPRLQSAGLSLASPALWALATFGAVAAAMAAVTGSNTTYGSPPVVVALVPAAAVLMFAALGFVVGRVSPWRMTAPLMAIATYVALGAASYSAGVRYLSPTGQLFAVNLPAWWWAPASIASYVAAGAGAVLLLGPRSRWFAVPVLAVAVLAAVPVSRAGADAFHVNTAAEELVCAAGSPQVCLTRRHADELAAVTQAVQAVLAGLDVPRTIDEQRFGHGLRDPNGTLNTLYIGADLHGRPDLAVVREDAAQRALRWGCAGGPYPPDDDLALATISLTDWVRDRPPPPYAGVLQGLTEPGAVALVKRFAAAASACDLASARTVLNARP